MRICFFTLIFSLVALSSAFAEPSLTKNVEYYDIKGWDAALIHQEMDAKGPVDRNSGNRVWAHTHWRIKWKFDYLEENLNCSIQDVRTDVTVDFVVPRWTERDKASASVQSKWDKFYTALQQHEQQHALYGIQAAREIEKIIPTLPKKRLCKQIGEDANARAQEIIRKYNKKDIEFDAKTDHGRTEGVTF